LSGRCRNRLDGPTALARAARFGKRTGSSPSNNRSGTLSIRPSRSTNTSSGPTNITSVTCVIDPSDAKGRSRGSNASLVGGFDQALSLSSSRKDASGGGALQLVRAAPSKVRPDPATGPSPWTTRTLHRGRRALRCACRPRRRSHQHRRRASRPRRWPAWVSKSQPQPASTRRSSRCSSAPSAALAATE
jgi:hypothetical protein